MAIQWARISCVLIANHTHHGGHECGERAGEGKAGGNGIASDIASSFSSNLSASVTCHYGGAEKSSSNNGLLHLTPQV